MTFLLERLRPDADEETPVTAPQPRPRAAGVPRFAGVYGLDPAVTAESLGLLADDYEVAARYTALACAVHVYGTDALRATWWPFGKKAVAANLRMRAWLLDKVATPEAAARRRFALRLACEQGTGLEIDDLLRLAQDFADGLTP